MNDIMFFLMLFFLIVSTLVNPNVIKLMLPKASAGQTVSKQPVTVSVSKDFQYYINNKLVPFVELESQLAAAVSGMPQPTVVLRVNNSITVQNLVDVLEIGNKLKVKMIMATNTAK
jgi:biopolymer transport protein ExbD